MGEKKAWMKFLSDQGDGEGCKSVFQHTYFQLVGSSVVVEK